MTIPQNLLTLARAETRGEASPTAHAASRVRFIEGLTPRAEARWMAFMPLAAGIAFVVVVVIGAYLMQRPSRTEPSEAASAAPSVETPSKQESEKQIPDADKVIAALRPQFKKCYHEGLQTDPTMSGKVVLGATVGPTGDVVMANVVSNTGLSEAVANCMVAVLKTAHFTNTGSTSTMTIPISFVAKGT